MIVNLSEQMTFVIGSNHSRRREEELGIGRPCALEQSGEAVERR
jgi:hypothetical protein